MKKFMLLAISLICFVSSSVFADSPPGLSNKKGAEFPRGLEKHEKVPHGWSKGKKQGWKRIRQQHQNHNMNRGSSSAPPSSSY